MDGKVKRVWMPLSIFLVLTASIMWLTGNLHFGAPGVGRDGAEAGHGHEEAGHGDTRDSHEGHGEAAHGDDLGGAVDLDSLEKLECEHDMRAVDCDNCRFEIVVVKLKTSTAKGLVSTETLQEIERSETIRVTGQVKLDPTRTVEVSSVGGGVVIRSSTSLGDRVTQGDVLAVIRSSEFGEAKAAYIDAVAKLRIATKTLERERGLYAQSISSEADHLEAIKESQSAEGALGAAEKRLHLFGLNEDAIKSVMTERHNGGFADIALSAPRSGTIISQSVSQGRLVQAGQPLFKIADTSSLWVWCDVYPNDLAALHDGLSKRKRLDAVVRVSAFKNTAFPGTVDLISSIVDEHTRTAKLRIRIANKDGRLRPGMFVHAEIVVPAEGRSMVVPREAILSDEGKHFVFQHWKNDLWVKRTSDLRYHHSLSCRADYAREASTWADKSVESRADAVAVGSAYPLAPRFRWECLTSPDFSPKVLKRAVSLL